MPALTSEQVAQAYGMNLLPAAAQLQDIGNNYARQQVLADERNRRQRAEQMQGLGLIQDVTGQLEKGTGFSPIDDLNAQRIGGAKQRATQRLMQGSDPTSVYMQLQNETNGIRAEQAAVVKRLGEIDNITKQAVQKDDILDPNLVRAGLLQEAFYETDDKGNRVLRQDVNSNIDYATPVLNPTPENRLKYANQVALNRKIGERLPKVFPTQQQIADGTQGNIQGQYVANIPQTHVIDPQTGKVMLATTPYDIRNPEAERSMTATPFQDAGLPAQIVAMMKADPDIDLLVRQEEQKVINDYGKIDPEVVTSIAARRIVEQHGTKGDAAAKFDDSKYKRAYQENQDKINLGFKQRQEGRANRSLALSEGKAADSKAAKAKAAEEDAITPNTILTQYEKGTLAENGLGQQLAQTQTIMIPTPLGINVPAIKVHGLQGKPFLEDPNSGSKMKVYLYTDPVLGEKVYSVTRYRKSTDAEKKVNSETNTSLDAATPGYMPLPPVVYSGDKAKTFRTGIAPQLEPASKAKQKVFNETVEIADEIQ